MPEPHLRAGDSDRAAVATVLGKHMADGRLTVAEYDDRVSRAYAAQTYGELAELTADLPAVDSPRPVVSVPDQQPAPVRGRDVTAPSGHSAVAWASWRRTAIIVLAIWAITSISAGGFLYFWPLWVIGPWGAVLLAQTMGGTGRPRSRRRT
jgi:hypothetical protein